jgi:hypothetical protein
MSWETRIFTLGLMRRPVRSLLPRFAEGERQRCVSGLGQRRPRATIPCKNHSGDAMPEFTQTVLYTDTDGRARFGERVLALSEGTPASRLSPVMPSAGYQLRQSPVGFRSQFHCTEKPQWVFILGGQMEIGLQGGHSRIFKPGEHFYSADVLPAGATFDPAVHGHWSRQVGDEPLVTLFVKDV